MKRFSVLLLITIITATVFYGCAEKKPDKYGVFVKINKKTVEIYKVSKTPNIIDIDPDVIEAYDMALKEDQKYNDYLYRVVERDRKATLALSEVFGNVSPNLKMETTKLKSSLVDFEGIIKQPVFNKVSKISIRDEQAKNTKIWYRLTLRDSLVESNQFKFVDRDTDWVDCEPNDNLKHGCYCINFTTQKPTSLDQFKYTYMFLIGTNKAMVEDLNNIKNNAYVKILKLNISEFQWFIEKWSIESEGGYPVSFDLSSGYKNNTVFKMANGNIQNPYSDSIPAMVLSLSDPPVWDNIKSGQVVYVPLFKKKFVIGYKIYSKSDSGPLDLVLKSAE